jgi:hypothetical protein
MVIKRELARLGARALVQTQFIGISGQVCSIVYEVTGPTTEHFTEYAEAERALRSTEPVAAWREPQSWEVNA